MKEIKEITDEIWDELHGAKHYAERALIEKRKDIASANQYADMARQELGHVENLHKMVEKLVKDKKAAGYEPPASMQAVWDWEHQKMIEKAAKVRVMLDMVRE